MKTKKILVVGLTLALSLSIVACSKKETTPFTKFTNNIYEN